MSNKTNFFLRELMKPGWAMLLLLTLCMSCNKEDEPGNNNNVEIPDPLQPQPAITTTVAGIVIDENGKPVAEATITVHGETTVTGQDGGFFFESIEVPGNRVVIESLKEGYFSGIRALTPQEDRQTEVRIVLMGSPVTHTFQASTGSNAALSNGSEVQIPANALVTSSGDPYTGPVSMSLRYLDPTAGNFGVLVPGGDMLAQREDQSTSVLYSYGILRVLMKDPTGDELQLAGGQTSTLIMSIADDQLATAPSTIPLWFFDEEKGIWQEDGVATRNGNQYIGTVTHFTDWNCDSPNEGATIIGRLVDCTGNPAWGVVEFGQVTSDPQSSTESGESDGKFERRVPDGVQITVIISDPLLITPLTPNERGKVIVIVPPLAPGQVYDVGDIQTFPCPAQVTATFKTKAEDAVAYATFETDQGYKVIYDPGSSMSVNLPPNIDVRIDISTNGGIVAVQNIHTPDDGGTLDLGLIDLSTAPVPVGEAIIIGRTVCYGELETEGQITVSWDDGTNNSNLNYTAPDANGVFRIQAPANMSVEISSSTASGTWTRTVQTPGNAGDELDMGTIELCENTAVGETSFKVTGDGLDNEMFTVVMNKNMPNFNMGIYYPSSDLTLGLMVALNDQVTISLFFPGKTTGVKTTQDQVAVTIERKTSDRTVYYWGGTIPESNLNLTITRYDDVGGVIEGTFSGTFLVADEGESYGEETVTIAEGKFSVLRYPDAF